jgi:hypothetical protein
MPFVQSWGRYDELYLQPPVDRGKQLTLEMQAGPMACKRLEQRVKDSSPRIVLEVNVA